MKTILTILLMLTVALSVTLGSTNVPGGNVSGTWNLAGSPYYVQGEITVPLGSLLTIEPGVEVIFTGHYKMIVNGQLTAIGTNGQQILFTASSTWNGIRIMNSNTNGQDSTRLVYCNFTKGNATGTSPDFLGGALYIISSNDVLIRGCNFYTNSASVGFGGAIYITQSNIRIEKSLFRNNTAIAGGGIYINYGTPKIDHVTMVANTGTSGAAVYKNQISGVVTIKSSIVWNNSSNPIEGQQINVSYSDIEGGYSGIGNVNVDPSFRNASGYDYSLMPCSPCIDTGDPSFTYDPDGTRADMGAFYYDQNSGPLLTGDVSGTLLSSLSPYYACGDVTVPLDSLLIIEPGVEIRFASDSKMDVYGQVVAEGTAADSIVFTAMDTTGYSSGSWPGWNGISLLNSNTNGQDSSLFSYCQVNYVDTGGQPFNLSSSSDTRLSHSTIANNSPNGRAIWLQQSNALIEDCIISDNFSENTITVDNSSPTIRYCQFTSNTYSATGYCISAGSASMPAISNCTFDVDGLVPILCYPNAVRSIHGNTYNGTTYRHVYVEGGTLSLDSEWENPGIPYRMRPGVHFYIQGTDGPDGVTTLELEAGVMLQFAGSYLWIGHDSNPSIPGALVAVGTAGENITFTTSVSSPSPGNWYGIYFARYSDDAQCRLEYCNVEYAGYSSYENIMINEASPSILNTISRYGSGNGIFITSSPSSSSMPVITNCQLTGNTSYGIYSSKYSLPVITGCTFDANTYVPVYCYPDALRGIYDNTFTGTNYLYFDVVGDVLSLDSEWRNQGVYYRIINNNLLVQGKDGADLVTTLTLDPGVTMKFTGTFGLTVGHDTDPTFPGALIAAGTSGQNITFTTTSTTPLPGSWGGIYFADYSDDAQCRLDYCMVENGGYSSYENLFLNNSSPQILNTVSRYGSGAGIYVNNSSSAGTCSPIITGGQVTGNTTYGIYINNTSTAIPCTPVITGCQVTNNSSYGMYLYCNSSSSTCAPVVSYCQFTGNAGCGLYNAYFVQPTVTNCAFNTDISIPIYIDHPNAVRGFYDNTFTGGDTYKYISVNGGTLSLDSEWKNQDVPYRLNGIYLMIMGQDGPDGVTALTLDPGVTLQFNGNSLWVGHDSNPSIPGALVAVGTAGQNVTFTSSSSTPSPGNWCGIYFANYSDDSQCRLEYCTVEYGGYSGSYDNIWLNNASPQIINTTSQYGDGMGISIISNLSSSPSSPLISGCQLTGNTNYGIYISCSSSSNTCAPVISGCQFTDNTMYGIYSTPYALPEITGCTFDIGANYPPIFCCANTVRGIHDNTYNGGSTHRYIYVVGSTLSLDSYWENPGIPYRLSGNIYIQGADGPDLVTTLTLEPGTVLKFTSLEGLTVGHDSNPSYPGALVAVGTPEQKITFTSSASSPSPGNWYGLYFANYSDDTQCRLAYCIVEYAGYSSYENIQCNGSSPVISHCESRFGSGPGIWVSNATNMNIDHSVIRDNTVEGIWAQNSSLSLSNNVICRNAGDALRFASPLSTEVKQNIIYDNHSPLYLASGSILATQIDYNDFWLHDTVYWSHMAPGFGNATQTNANGDMCDGYYNIFLDPMFVNATGNDFHLTENSPCINAGDPLMPFDPDSTIADMGVYSYYKPGYASITSIKDVPNDQGRQVQVIWGKSPLDESGGGQIEFYSLWREDPIFKEGGKEVISEREELYDKIKTDNDAGQETGVVLEQEDPLYWDNEGTILTYIASIPAMGFSQYSYIAPTLKDSCAASINYSKFELFAHTFNPLVYYRAVPDSGYSVDNIAPGAPLNLDGELAGDHISLDWDACTDPDFQHYALYKSEAPGSFPEIPFATTTDTLFNDFEIAFDTLYYRAAAYDINGNKSDYSNTVMVPINTGITLDLKVFLGGAYYGPYMSNSLNTAGFIPLSHPYGMTPWNYSGTEAVSSIPSANITDWVLIELRDALSASQATSATCFARQAAFLKIDGQVVGLDGSSLVNFSTEATHNLYVVVWHRNHLQIMSANAVTKTGGIYPYDFTTAMGQAYGGANAQKQVAPGIWAMIGGNGKPDNQVDNLDKNDVWRPESGLSGYKSGDFNLNGQVNNSDKVDVWRPNTGLGSQVPL